MRVRPLAGMLALGLATKAVAADPSPFDLVGPSLQVSVSHHGVSLPIAEVPHLSAGDEVSVRADLPADQSAHYLLVAAFLRGATNPPPEKWFFQSETWTKKGRAGLKIKVPDEAQQMILFLAPETGGDFPTLKNAVRGRPGAFVRASQDLNQASLDHGRLDTFLRAVRAHGPADAERLEAITPLLARSLAVKINPDCLQKMPELQAACLMQNQDSLVLNDGHSNAITEALAGPGSDLALQLSATPQGGLGYYSPYIAAIRDIIGILSTFHTAKYQYVPGLATPSGDRLNLILNTAPSFHNPKSVLVTALPAIAPSRVPPLQAAESDPQLCAQSSELVLPVSGAPLAFSTHYAHDMMLRVRTADGHVVELPATPDVEKGGFVVATAGLRSADLKAPVDATLHGQWGFQPFDGPTFRLQSAGSGQWHAADTGSLIIGREGTVTLAGGAAACVASVSLRQGSGEEQPLRWKANKPDEIDVVLPLANARAGGMTLLVRQPGARDAEAIALNSYAQPTHVEGLDLHAGDAFGTLSGSGLDGVDVVTVDGVAFRPGALAHGKDGDALRLEASDAAAVTGWKSGQSRTAKVTFKDGRTSSLKLAIGNARLAVKLIGKNLQSSATTTPIAVQLGNPDELPHDARLTFSLQAQNGASFTGGESVEIATVSGSGSTMLTSARGLTLQDTRVVVATLDAAQAFGPSVFGPIRFRIVQDGIAGDWQPLGTMVRLPILHQLHCPDAATATCQLTGDNLFLIASLSATPGFEHPVDVPEGYPGNAIQVPHPADGQLYVRLRDDPAVVSKITN